MIDRGADVCCPESFHSATLGNTFLGKTKYMIQMRKKMQGENFKKNDL